MGPRFCVCCPLLASTVHCSLSSALDGLFLPFFLLLSSFLSLPVHERIHPAGCGCFLCDGQQRVSAGLRGTRPREGKRPWGGTVLAALCLQHSQAKEKQTEVWVSVRTSLACDKNIGGNVSHWQLCDN